VVERRFTSSVVGLMLIGGEESRRNPDAPRHIGGYAAKWNTYSRDLGQFVEQLLPATYNKSRGDGWPDVICRFNHKDEQLLGTIAGGTLSLGVDRDGLLYDVEPPESMRHVVEWVQRGDVQKSSHAFRCVEDEWSMTTDGAALRTIHSAQLVDTAPVVTPAYADTTAGLRSLAAHMGAGYEEVRSLADQHELRKFFIRTDADGGARPRKTMYPAAAMAMLNARRADPFE
jgi:HK97 family phage prohead protease